MTALVPRLHVVTDDRVLAMEGFVERASALMDTHGQAVALHLRGHGLPGAELYRLARALDGPARAAGTPLLANDRVDVALAVGCGAHLGQRSIPVARARALLGPDAALGYSAHEVAEAASAAAAGADFVMVGTIWPSPSHPDVAAAGEALVTAALAATNVPIVAIGGVTPARAAGAVEAGAHGVAVLSGVWSSEDPAAAAGAYLDAMVGAPR